MTFTLAPPSGRTLRFLPQVITIEKTFKLFIHFSSVQQTSFLKCNELHSFAETRTCDRPPAEGRSDATHFLRRYVEQEAFIKMLNDAAT